MAETLAKHDFSFRAYTRFVRFSKLTLSLIILLLLVFMVLIPLLGHEKDENLVIKFASVEQKKDTPPIMLNPKFQGVDNNNQPYLVTASSALQADESTVVLDEVNADLTTTQGRWLALLANQGTLNLTEEYLILQGNVQLYHDAGHEMRTEQVRIDLKNLNAFGESSVQIQGEFGHIQADRFAILDKGDRMRFQNHVYVLLLP